MTTPVPSQAAMSRFVEIDPRAEPAPHDVATPAPLHEARLRITGMTEYGAALAGVLGGTVSMPLEGVRLDLEEGTGARGAAGVVEPREMTRLHASDARYRWVNTLSLRGTGTADLAAGEIHVVAFQA